MSDLLNVNIVVACCSQSRRKFGIRFEEKAAGQWVADWAFAIAEKAIRKEGYEGNTIVGTFTFSESYPGCPYCGNRVISKHITYGFGHRCGRISCWNGHDVHVVCAWCETHIYLNVPIADITASSDR